ncbi:MAG TPA: histidinol-phosphate transaminase [Acidobacteriota bacterium]|nr:histidinol-phosphate transaminase [Acidobacteriota bacterium]HRR57536.1 histidinol-phosphate transaminase [Acidobacteriota bacterium]
MRTADTVLDAVREAVLRLEPYHCAREQALDGILLDANENPYPRTHDGVLLNRYPDPYQRALRTALSRYVGLGSDWLLAGNGSDEVLDWVFKVFDLRPGVAVAEPTYGMYRVLADLYDVPVITIGLDEGFRLNANRFLQQAGPSRLAFLCSPNNPTGNLLDSGQIRQILDEWSGIVVLDEAYIEFSAGSSLIRWVEQYPNLLVLRTLSKAFGRAGLRLGYVAAHPDLIACFLKVKAPYNLSAWTQAEGFRALEDLTDMLRQVRTIVAERDRLLEELRSTAGVLEVFPSDANFILFRCRDATRVWQALFDDGVVVRNRSSVKGLENCIRVSVGTGEENRTFLERLRFHLERL